ncbi:MAG: hypothetical protein UX98_C0004G0010 [Parcubacteria group bacterium GW2011_GWA2_47_26]|nr:MAG: hypothetical protein UX98_C0004G0010 [Parcubacteria group bacterium GW2011_GWA2_47_26]
MSRAIFVFSVDNFALQQKFVVAAAEIEAQMENQTRATGRIEELFESLLHRAFSGAL